VPTVKRETSDSNILATISRRGSDLSKEKVANLGGRVGSGGVEILKERKALVEAELQWAIAALKKPNRRLAGKTIAEDAERRLFQGPTYIRSKPTKLRGFTEEAVN
jgi:hypothetical protein